MGAMRGGNAGGQCVGAMRGGRCPVQEDGQKFVDEREVFFFTS